MKLLRWLRRLLGKDSHKAANPQLDQYPEWIASKIGPYLPSTTSSSGNMDDLAKSIRAAIDNVDQSGNIFFGVPDDNHEVMEALHRAGGEIRVTIRCASRPILDLLSQDSVLASGSPSISTAEIPSLEGTFFTGGNN